MHCVTLIVRPRRAAAIVAAVGMLFGVQGALSLRWPQPADAFSPSGYAATGLLLAAIAASIVALGVLAPLHSRSGSIAVSTSRIGLVLSVLPLAASTAAGHAIWTPVLVAGLLVATVGMAGLVRARRHEGDLPAGLLEVTLAGTLLGVILAATGGCLLPGACWLAVAMVLWSSYASEARVPFTAAT